MSRVGNGMGSESKEVHIMCHLYYLKHPWRRLKVSQTQWLLFSRIGCKGEDSMYSSFTLNTIATLTFLYPPAFTSHPRPSLKLFPTSHSLFSYPQLCTHPSVPPPSLIFLSFLDCQLSFTLCCALKRFLSPVTSVSSPIHVL